MRAKYFLYVQCIILISLFSPSITRADDHNYQNYVIGEEASGMGGAYTALSEGPDGTYYNPGGLAFAKDAQVSVSANVARYTRGTLKNRIALTLGADSIQENLNLSALQVIPASAVTVKTFNFPFESKYPEGEKRNAVALSFYVPDAVLYKGSEDVTGGATSATLSYRLEDSVLLAGPSYSRRINDRLGLGVSLYYVYRAFESTTFLSASNATEFQQSYVNADYNYGGFMANLGVKWRATDHWHFGASLVPYSIRLHGSGRNIQSTTTEAAVSDTNPKNNNFGGLEVNLPLPMKIVLGAAFVDRGKMEISGDVRFYLPHNYTSVHDPQGRATDAVIHQEFVTNGNIGLAYWLAEHWPLRLGVFSNFSASPGLGTTGAASSLVDYYGGTCSLSYDNKPFSTTVGLQTAYGEGSHLSAGAVQNFDLLHLTGFVASSFRF